jgi:hypothetical protein
MLLSSLSSKRYGIVHLATARTASGYLLHGAVAQLRLLHLMNRIQADAVPMDIKAHADWVTSIR